MKRRILVMTAVPAERDAVQGSLLGRERFVVVAGGVGVASAAATTARMLATGAFDLVISAGIAGGFTGRAEIGDTVLATASVAADLGADSPDGFLSLDQLGFGSSTVDADSAVLAALRELLPKAVVGEVLTVSTVTGTAEQVTALLDRRPGAVAEAMEGFGVATAANQGRIPFAELRTISNPIGPRDQASWRLADALAALRQAATVLVSLKW